jgi:rhodanese-related sulfurtransferase
MALGRRAYEAKHIPGSLHFDRLEEARAALDPDEEIVLYCANPACPASVYAYRELERAGYRRLRRYAGGLEDWEAAGYPLEGLAIGNESTDTGCQEPRNGLRKSVSSRL